jgi:hypothetical protein
MSTTPRKGAEIKFIGGVYKGNGFLDRNKDASADYTYVIAPKKKGRNGKITMEYTKVLHEHYVLLTEIQKASTYEEAMLDQCSDIDSLLNKVVKKMAECEMVDGKGSDSCKKICSIVADRLDRAVVNQTKKGSAARWRRVLWPRS